MKQTHPLATAATWSRPPQPLILAGDEVHVWRASLAQPAARVAELFAVLDAAERDRAARFRFHKDQQHFIVARGILRQLLGRYLNRPPAELKFSYSMYGKPALDSASPDEPTLQFNLAHSHTLALYAFTYGRQVGIDLEYARTDFASAEIAERFFSAREVAMLRALDPELQSAAFFNCWTRKEAYIKARGEGLSHPLNSFAVSLRPGEPAALLSVDDNVEELARWTLEDLNPAPGYAAALVVEQPDWQLKCFEWV